MRQPTRTEYDGAIRQSKQAETAAEHIDAARVLLDTVKPTGTYVITPVAVSMAQVHATIAAALVAAGDRTLPGS